jgi:uncharacterized protein YndB with AHSA1/START domain
LLEYEMRAGGKFRAYPNERIKAFPQIPDIILDGEVVEAKAPRKLVQTWRMLMDPTLAAEGFTLFTLDIEPVRGGVTNLTVTHDATGAPNLAALVDGKCESAGAGDGWSEVVSGLKVLLETGVQLPSRAVHKRAEL